MDMFCKARHMDELTKGVCVEERRKKNWTWSYASLGPQEVEDPTIETGKVQPMSHEKNQEMMMPSLPREENGSRTKEWSIMTDSMAHSGKWELRIARWTPDKNGIHNWNKSLTGMGTGESSWGSEPGVLATLGKDFASASHWIRREDRYFLTEEVKLVGLMVSG